jgi:hypothetical protein
MKALDIVVDSIAKSLNGKSKSEKLSFYLNAYNANILDKILSDYPTNGPGGGGLLGRNKFFKAKNVKAAGGVLTFINAKRTTKLPSGTKVTFQDYSWKLNASR